MEPSQLDINVHPTKQEIKFEDEKIVYAFVQAAVKHALAQFSITPALDFDLDPGIQQLDAVSKPVTAENTAAVISSSLYHTFTQPHQAHFIEAKNRSELRNWKDFYEAPQAPQKASHSNEEHPSEEQVSPVISSFHAETRFTQLQLSYIIVATAAGFMLIHQQSAHERVLYNRYESAAQGKPIPTQRSMFPDTLQLSAQDAVLLTDLMNDLNELGYLIEPFGKNSFVIQGTPANVKDGNDKIAIERILEQFKHFSNDLKLSRREKIMRALSRQHAVKCGTLLNDEEMRTLVTALFAGAQSNSSPDGNPTYIEFKKEYLDKVFGK